MAIFDKFLDSIFENFEMTKEAIEIKKEMNELLVESLEETIREGFSFPNAVEICMERFGSLDEISNELQSFHIPLRKNETASEQLVYLFRGSLSESDLRILLQKVAAYDDSAFELLDKIRDINYMLDSLKKENAETIAVIARHLKPTVASELFSALPIELATNVLIEVFKHDERKGTRRISSILNNVTRSTEKRLFEELNKRDEALSTQIKNLLFIFEDIIEMDKQSLAKVINHITDNELIALALKTANSELTEKFKSNMSLGRWNLIEDANEGLGRVRLSEVENAQQQIVSLVKKLEKDGYILISRGDVDVII